MIRSLVTAFIFCFFTSYGFADNHVVSGRVTDSLGTPLEGVSVALLYAGDSTLASFAITDRSGNFTIEDAKEGKYVLNISLMGYYSEYKNVTVGSEKNVNTGTLVLQANERITTLDEVVVSAEKIPIKINGDTIEYNAGSFKTKPNAVAEDLLRKLPGIEVDKEGNIKAMGKDVKKVLVDGKEFFGDDPKVATKNLPADAIDKVQTYQKHSDRSEFTGIDDGERDQTINLQLKDGKKTGYFGDVNVGGGYDKKYEGGIKAFQFRPKSQFAALGMLNNINKFGFSMQDYINLNGGLSSIMGGNGSISFNMDDDMPVDFGQPVTGDITSGALGLNYSYEARKNNRFNISYMGNGAKKNLDELTDVQNFTPGGRFDSKESREKDSKSFAHVISSRWRNDVDSSLQLTMNGSLKLKNNDAGERNVSQTYTGTSLINDLLNTNTSNGLSYQGVISTGLVKKLKSKWQIIQGSANFNIQKQSDQNIWNNITNFYSDGSKLYDNQYQDNNALRYSGGADLSVVRAIGNGYFLVPGFNADFNSDHFTRIQGAMPGFEKTDSLSPAFYRNNFSVSPEISLKKSSAKQQWNAGVKLEKIFITPFDNGLKNDTRSYTFVVPSVFWRNDLGRGKNISFAYRSGVNAPTAIQMLPYTDYSNPLMRMSGNIALNPEYYHDFNFNYSHFDQFTMSSIFIFLNGRYTRDKINIGRTIYPDLSQDLKYVNAGHELRASLGAEYSTPVRKLGVNVNVRFNETYTSSQSPVNDVINQNSTFKHELEASFSNRKNDKWDLRLGGNIELSNSAYSLNKELNNTYFNYTGFAQAGYQPNDRWIFNLSADITRYAAQSFGAPVTIPILKAEFSRFILPNNRGTITLKGFDLLNKNTSVFRSSQLNYLVERRSNIIGRYFMLSFNYKLSKTGKSNIPGAVEFK